MKLPNLENAVVPEAKITNYLLSVTHIKGHSKAIFFLRFGFSPDEWEVMASALKQHASEHDIKSVDFNGYGQRFVIEGAIKTPDNRNPFIRSIWFITDKSDVPSFVSAYPEDEREDEDD